MKNEELNIKPAEKELSKEDLNEVKGGVIHECPFKEV